MSLSLNMPLWCCFQAAFLLSLSLQFCFCVLSFVPFTFPVFATADAGLQHLEQEVTGMHCPSRDIPVHPWQLGGATLLEFWTSSRQLFKRPLQIDVGEHLFMHHAPFAPFHVHGESTWYWCNFHPKGSWRSESESNLFIFRFESSQVETPPWMDTLIYVWHP